MLGCLADNTCPHCHNGYQSSCQQREFVGGAQAPLLRVPLADGTLVATREVPPDDLIPSLLAVSDAMGTGWFAADAANVKPGAAVAVVGDGAVGLLGILSAKLMGAERIIAMSRYETRQELALEYGATDIVAERGDDGVVKVKELTKRVGDGLGGDLPRPRPPGGRCRSGPHPRRSRRCRFARDAAFEGKDQYSSIAVD